MPYIPNTDTDQAAMLQAIGLSSMDDLFADIPAALQIPTLNLPEGRSEADVYNRLHHLSHRNAHDLVCFLGGGFYDHFIPACVDELSARSEFYTAYTPYQPEASQGTLQAIFEYQTVISRLTDM